MIGNEKLLPRHKGVPNKLTADLKAMILGALEDVGGREYLAQRAIDTPSPFLALLGKILPMQVVGDRDRPLAISFEWAPARSLGTKVANDTAVIDAAMEIVWEAIEEDDANGGTDHQGAQQATAK